jgi:hypothetical protein
LRVRTLLILAISASLAVSGCSAIPGMGGGQPPVTGGLCEQNVAAGARAADAPTRTAALDTAIRTCRTLAQWAAAVEAYGGDAVTPDAATYLGARCAEPTSGVGRYMLCGLLAESLRTPAPTHKSKRKPKKTPKPSPSPSLVLVVASPPPPVSPVAPVPPASSPRAPLTSGGSLAAH